MTLDEIKTAAEAGKTVHWASDIYVVLKDCIGQWLVQCTANNCCWGLTHADGKTLNGKEEQFYERETIPPLRGGTRARP